MGSRSILIGAGVLAVTLVGCVAVVAFVCAAEPNATAAKGRPSIRPAPVEVTAPVRATPKPAPVTRRPPGTPSRTTMKRPVELSPIKRVPRVVSPRELRLPKLTRPLILIEKADHRLTVFDGVRAVKTYRCAVGGGRADKTREGDHCTPEGDFYVCVKNPASKYTRALGLSYPSIEDARRGLRDRMISRTQHNAIVNAINQGKRPPWKTPLGGEIMIHGAGAGRDWTQGCIALDDADILELYAAVGLHVPVRIVP